MRLSDSRIVLGSTSNSFSLRPSCLVAYPPLWSVIITPVPPANDLRQLFRVHSILTLDELKRPRQVAMTVFRKLRPLAYPSYSHRGKYYTLNEIARFDQLGLWSHHQVRFSRHRTLINTCAAGRRLRSRYSADELEHLLHVQVKDPLRKLALQGRIRRSNPASAGSTSRPTKHYHAQLRARHIACVPSVSSVGRVVPDELRAAIILFYSLLDRQRRLYAALESLKIGHGGAPASSRRRHLDVQRSGSAAPVGRPVEKKPPT